MNSKDWRIPFKKPDIPKALTDAGYPPLLSAVLALRGIVTAEEADVMINGGADCLYDPMLIMGMDKAAARVRRRASESRNFCARLLCSRRYCRPMCLRLAETMDGAVMLFECRRAAHEDAPLRKKEVLQ